MQLRRSTKHEYVIACTRIMNENDRSPHARGNKTTRTCFPFDAVSPPRWRVSGVTHCGVSDEGGNHNTYKSTMAPSQKR